MKLGKMIAAYRDANGRGVRDLAGEIDISHATLNRIERGYPCDSNTLLKVIIWMMGK